ncbi:glycine cleavage system transcriptional repressor [Aurantivibrio plasticivorans]
MTRQIVMTTICNDRPGIVETLSRTVSENGGNWLDSHLSHYAGKFAGIIHVSVTAENCESLMEQLSVLANDGIQVTAELADTKADPHQQHWSFTLFGNDRPGIIKEVSQALAHYHINLEQLSSRCTTAAHTGIPLFEAEGMISLPDTVDIDELEDQLATISNQLTVDIQLEEAQ